MSTFDNSALAGILLKSESVYFFFSTIFGTILNNSDICSAVTVNVRIRFLKLPLPFNTRAMERASGNYAFVC